MPQSTISSSHIWTAAIAAGTAAVIYFFTKFYAARERIWTLQRANLPMPKFSFLGGHFPVLGKVMRSLPSDSIVHNIMWHISHDYPNGIFYMSLWPFTGTVMIIADADAASQVEGRIIGKGPDIIPPLETITGGKSLLTMEGEEWKKWRRLFNPGFSAGYMMGLAPLIADEVAVFRQKLLDRCSEGVSEVFQLEDLTLRLTFDIIGSVVLDVRLRHQVEDHPLATALRRQIEWTTFSAPLNPLTKYFTVRPLVHWLNGKHLDRCIGKELDERLTDYFSQQPSSASKAPSKSVASLFIDEYVKEMGEKRVEDTKEAIKKIITPQVRLFLLAGHDTTSSTLLYCYHLLSKNPKILSRVVEEHNEIFGLNSSQVQDKIHQDPQLLNKIPYTLAFIKEVLRIYPPAGAMREGSSDLDIIDEDGRAHPTEDCSIWTLILAIHHNPKYWKDPELCIPERWLVGPEDPLYPHKGAWRPFEWGPRSCIGQTLALLELRIALAMTVREFKITAAYDEWDQLHAKRGIKTINGDRVYQAAKGGGGAHPADEFPVRIELR
ncbi:hypothetical protein CkaCkLH20_03033 [Colletotrichum karsti]|uniref:Sterigmatocystin biosynthesis P450 monooxygenase stcS n=1 Tax=Colletotrichum karsti TaxID=1095194 RepID=A0A9P6IHZ1_9PEZI|nr:uncharacterized protein CkaCkLH20_03033 [Colletotrichum karsti]KAF9879490.1 hypothetical protein CkaCkLH20_03033 [Colletotrichum karsti]